MCVNNYHNLHYLDNYQYNHNNLNLQMMGY